MSLDVYLTLPGATSATEPVDRIFVRRDGGTVEVTRAEWDETHPGREPIVMTAPINEREVYDANITHNLGKMAAECDLYLPLWEPEEIGATHARDLIEPLRAGLARLGEERERLQEFNPSNGWGNYDGLVRFVTGYLAACEAWPDAEVQVSR